MQIRLRARHVLDMHAIQEPVAVQFDMSCIPSCAIAKGGGAATPERWMNYNTGKGIGRALRHSSHQPLVCEVEDLGCSDSRALPVHDLITPPPSRHVPLYLVYAQHVMHFSIERVGC